MLPLLFSVVIGVIDAPVQIENCEVFHSSSSSTTLQCDVSNLGKSAIAKMEFDVLGRDPAREVPWISLSQFNRGFAIIAGGIEPGETLRERIHIPRIPERANLETLIIEVLNLEVIGADGQLITKD